MTNQTPSDTDEWLDEILVFTGHYDTGQTKAAIQAKFEKEGVRFFALGKRQAERDLEARHLEEVQTLLLRIKEELKQHTVPEGRDLITRSYVNNTIDFELERIKHLQAEEK